MASISDEKLQELRDRTDIVQVVQRQIGIERCTISLRYERPRVAPPIANVPN